RRAVAEIFDDRASVLDLAVSGAVDFIDVERAAAANLDARRAFAARLRGRALLAIQASRENPRRRRLTDAANPGEQKRVRDSAPLQRFAERARHVLLADQFREALGPPFAREYEVWGLRFGHREIFSLGTARRMIARHPCGTGWQPVPLLPSGPGGVRGLPLRRTRLSAAGSPENCSSAFFFGAPYYSITAAFLQPPMTNLFRAHCNSIVPHDGVGLARLLSQLSWHRTPTRSSSG